MKTTQILWMGTALAMLGLPALADGRGTDGELRITFPQATSTLNPYLSSGTKDVYAASMVLEPLAGFDENGAVYPRLVSEIPSLENGGISADNMSITWKLIPGIKWSDGTPLTADDVVFTWEYNTHPGVPSVQKSTYEAVSNVTAVEEMVNMISASRSYQNNVEVMNTAKSLLQKTLQLGQR